MQLLESPPAQTQQGLTEEQQAVYDRLLIRGVSKHKAEELVRTYNISRIKLNLKEAVARKEKAKDLPAYIISYIEQDWAGQAEKNKKEAEAREAQRQQERRQAYDDFHGTTLVKIGKAEGKEGDEKKEMETEELTDIEVEIICKKGENAGGVFLRRMKKLGLTVDEVKAGRRK